VMLANETKRTKGGTILQRGAVRNGVCSIIGGTRERNEDLANRLCPNVEIIWIR
jgi:hypothetical protein